jgi:hypothetical protein
MRRLVFVLAVSFVTACANSDAIPRDILSKQKMETIIWQLIQSDEYVNIGLSKDTTKKISAEKMKIYQQVFDLNGVSMGEFKKSYQFYMEHPNISKEMFDSISVRANRQHMEIYTGKKDSLKPVPAPVPVSLSSNSSYVLKKDSVIKSRISKIRSWQDSMKHKAGKPFRKLTADSARRPVHP